MNTKLKNLIFAKPALSVLAIVAGAASSLSAVAAESVPPVASKLYPNAVSSLILDVEKTPNSFMAVGERGHILLSANGQDWSQVSTPVNSMLTAVNAVDENNAWAVGHDSAIVHTKDGGKNWELQNFDSTNGPLLDVFFDTPTHGFATGSFGVFLETNDAGKTWATADAPEVVDAAVHLYAIDKFESGRWLLVGEMGFIAVSDNGQDWTQIDSPYDGSFYSAAPYGDKGAILVGMRGNAYATDDLDSGEWRKYETNTVLSLTSVAALNSNEFVLTTLNRGLLHLASNGDITSLPTNDDASESYTGSFNDIVIHNGKLLIASDEGVAALDMPKPVIASNGRH